MLLREPLGAIIAFAIGAIVFTMAGDYSPAAALFPRAVAVIMMAAALAIGFRPFLQEISPPVAPIDLRSMRRIAGIIFLTLVYIVGVDWVGYVTCSVIFIPLTAWLLGVRNLALLVATTVLFVGAVTFLFRQLFHIPLPREVLLQFLG